MVAEKKARGIGRNALIMILKIINDKEPSLPLTLIQEDKSIMLISPHEKIVYATFSWEESLIADKNQKKVDEFEKEEESD